MYFQTILAGIIGAALTFAGQHFISVLHDRHDERQQLLISRRDVRRKFVQVMHRIVQQTGDYIEISQRGSLDFDYWEKLRTPLYEAWRDFSDSMVQLPELGDLEFLRAARRIHTLFSLRINCFYNEHPDAIRNYVALLGAEYPDLTPEGFHWNLNVTAANRKLYWSISKIIDDRALKLAQIEFNMSLRQLREIPPVDTPRIDDAEIYDQDDCWPSSSLIMLKHFRQLKVFQKLAAQRS